MGAPGDEVISEAFLQAVVADFEVHGEAVIALVRAEDPVTYMRVVAALMPEDMHDEVVGMTEQLSVTLVRR